MEVEYIASTLRNKIYSFLNTVKDTTASSGKLDSIFKYLHPHGIRLQWSIRKLLQIFANERHWSRAGKIDIDFFDFLWFFHCFSKNIRIRVRLLSFVLGYERTLVAYKFLRSFSSKWPHIVHLGTICRFFRNLPGRPFLFTDRPEKNW